MNISQNLESREEVNPEDSRSFRSQEISDEVVHRVSKANESVARRLLAHKNGSEIEGYLQGNCAKYNLSQETLPTQKEVSEWSSLDIYFRQALRTTLLSAEEEVALAKKLHNKPLNPDEEEIVAARVKLEGHNDIREIFLCANLRLVVSIAREYEGYGLPLQDLIQEGNLGLLKAVDRFNPEESVKFSTYGAYWIRKDIRLALHYDSRTISTTVHHNETLSKIDAAEQAFLAEHGELPTIEKLSELTQISLSSLQFVKSNIIHTESLTAFQDNGEGEAMDRHEIIPDLSVEEPGVRMSFDEDLRLVPEVLKQLDEREKIVIRHYFGVDGAAERTLKEISQMFSQDSLRLRALGTGRPLTRARIGQIKDATLVKARALIAHFDTTGAWPQKAQ